MIHKVLHLNFKTAIIYDWELHFSDQINFSNILNKNNSQIL